MIRLPIPAGQPLVVFSDLDGTLIDHHTYATDESRNAVAQLIRRSTPLVFCSSKTFAEQVQLQHELGIAQPFIFENGSGIAIPPGYFPVKEFAAGRIEAGYHIVAFAHADASTLRTALAQIPGMSGYADASDAELAAATGLSGGALARARARWFTETLLTPLNEDQAAQVNTQLEPAGFVLSRGGRFYTAQSAQINKGKSVRWMMQLFRQTSALLPCFAAIGDSLNDRSMLEVVDVPFLVQRPDNSWAAVDIPDLIRISGVGPAGFSAAVQLLAGGR